MSNHCIVTEESQWLIIRVADICNEAPTETSFNFVDKCLPTLSEIYLCDGKLYQGYRWNQGAFPCFQELSVSCPEQLIQELSSFYFSPSNVTGRFLVSLAYG